MSSLSDKNKRVGSHDSGKKHILPTAMLIVLFAALLVLCFVYRDSINADLIVRIMPSNDILRFLLILLMFAVKSFCIFIYCGILFAVTATLFPLPVAIVINILGTAVMVTLPYLTGKKAGANAVSRLVDKHPKLALIRKFRGKSGFLASFVIRVVMIFPSDPVSALLGAAGVSFWEHLLGSVLGIMPTLLAFTILGKGITDTSASAFVIFSAVMIAFTIVSVLLMLIPSKKKKKE